MLLNRVAGVTKFGNIVHQSVLPGWEDEIMAQADLERW